MNKPLFTGTILLPAITLIILIAYNVNYLPTSYILNDLADVLLIDEIATGLNHGAELSDFRLTQSPYYFPDLLFATTLKAIHPPANVAIWFNFFGWLTGTAGWFLLLKYSLKCKFETALCGSLAYFLIYRYSFTLSPDISQLAMFWGLVGHHSSVGILMPYCLIAVQQWIDADRSQEKWLSSKLITCTLLLFACSLSDRIFITGLIAPLAAVLLAININLLFNRRPFQHIPTLAVLLSLLISEQVFTKNIPYPQTYEFSSLYLHALINEFPTSTLQSISAFIFVLKSSAFTSVFIGAWLLGSVLLSLLVAKPNLLALLKSTDQEKLLFLIVVLALGSLITTTSQLVLGIFKDQGALRQLAGLCLSTLVGISAYLLGMLKRNTAIRILLVLVTWISLLTFDKSSLLPEKYESFYSTKDMQNCINYISSTNSDFISNYWPAVPIRMRAGTRGIPVSADLASVFTNGQNVEKIKKGNPRMAVADGYLREEILIMQFGAPSRRMECGRGFTLLDYSQNEDFLRTFSNLAHSAR